MPKSNFYHKTLFDKLYFSLLELDEAKFFFKDLFNVRQLKGLFNKTPQCSAMSPLSYTSHPKGMYVTGTAEQYPLQMQIRQTSELHPVTLNRAIKA